MSDEEKLEEAKRKPMPERVEHKLWKVRKQAFEEIKATCEKVFSEEDPVLSEYGPLLAKAMTDTNAAALDKALEAMTEYLQKCSPAQAQRVCDRTAAGIVAKALNGRPGTIQRATEVCLMFVEHDQQDKIMDQMISKGLGHKVPKVVLGSLDVIHKAVTGFGGKVVQLPPILKAVPPLIESRDAKARDKVKALVVEISRWVGADAVKGVLFEKMRDAMKGDIEKMIQEAPPGRPRPERLTRSEQMRQRMQEEAGGGGDADMQDDDDDDVMEVDEYDRAEAAEVVGELPKDFWSNLQEKKWSVRKGALTTLKTLANKPKLASGDYSELLRALKKIIAKDSNVQCVAEAIGCVGTLAKGLRNEFSSAARQFCPVLLEKFKEKNMNVCRNCSESLELLHRHCLVVADVVEDVIAALGHMNPRVKQETLGWLAGCLEFEQKDSVCKAQAQLVPAVAKCADDAMPATREKALAALVQFCLKASSSAAIEKITSKLDETRQKKLDELLTEARKNQRGGAGGMKSRSSAPAPKPASPPPNATAGPSRPPSAEVADTNMTDAPAAKSPPKPKASGPPARARGPPARAAARQGGAKSNANPPRAMTAAPAEDEGSLSSGVLTKEDAEMKLGELLGDGVVAQLKSTAWKERLECLDGILTAAKSIDAKANGKTLIEGIAQLPGWSEKNFQVVSRQFELIKLVAENTNSLSKSTAFCAIKGLIEKIADIKQKKHVGETLSTLCEVVGPKFIFSQMHTKASAHRNPKILAETITWMDSAVREFGLPVMDTKSLLAWVQEDLGNTNAAVRNAAISLVTSLYTFVGPPLGDMIRNGVKPALMATLETEFAKNPLNTEFSPTRRVRNGKAAAQASKPAAGEDMDMDCAMETEPEPAFDPDELLPRTDISGQLTSGLIGKISSSNWKERKAALDEVDQIISEAGNRIQPSVGDLMGALKGRMTDSNRNLAAHTLRLVAKIATAMGKAIDRQGRPVLTPGLNVLSDTKVLVRAAVIEMMTAWASVAGVVSLLPDLATALSAPKCGADGKKEALQWLAQNVKDGKDVQDALEYAVKASAVGSADKNAQVREAGGNLMETLIERYGSDVGTAIQALDGPLKKTAMEAYQKVGPPIARSAPAANPAPQKQKPAAAENSNAGGQSRLKPPNKPAAREKKKTKIPPPSPRGQDPMDIDEEEPLFIMNEFKEQRARKNRGKRAKYEGIPPDEAEMLKQELEPLVSPTLKDLLFTKDFKKHCRAADLIKDNIHALYDPVVSCVDLVFRWSTMRIAEGNTQCLVKTLDMLKTLMETMVEKNYRMSDYEAIVFLPGLIEKSGHNQDRIRKQHRELMQLASKVFSPPKVFTYIGDGLESKNNRTKVECAEEVGGMIDREGMRVVAGPKQQRALGVVAKAVSERDKSFRQACLGTLEVVYDFEGEKIWKLLGRLSDQQHSLIEERLKYRQKQLGRENLAPGYRGEDPAEANEQPDPVREMRPPPAQEGAFVPRPPANEAFAPRQPNPESFVPRQGNPESFAPRQATPESFAPPRQANPDSFVPRIPVPNAFAPPPRNASPMEMQTDVRSGGFGGPSPLNSIPDPQPRGFGGIPVPPLPSGPMEMSPRIISPTSQSPPLPDPPETASGHGMYGAIPTAPQQHPQESASRSDAEVEEIWSRALITMHSADLEDSINSMKVLCFELMEAANGNASPATEQLMLSCADEMIKELVVKMDSVFSEATVRAVTTVDPPSNRGCKYTLNTLMQAFAIPSLAQGIEKQSLCDLISSLLQLLLDERLPQVHEGHYLMKAMNVLMLKVLEKCNRNHVFGVLLFLLRSMPPKTQRGSPETQQRFVNLVVKCLIKTTKTMGMLLEQGKEDEIDIRELLNEIHDYFVKLGVDEIRKMGEEDDKPLRMVKTILHELCKHKGRDIVHYVQDIPRDEPPPLILAYIDLNLETLHNTGMITGPLPPAFSHNSHIMSQYFGSIEALQSPRNHQNPPVSPERTASDQTVNGIKAELATIFKKIGDKDLSREGMEDLYKFQQQNPHVDVMAYLTNTSEAFRAYIERGIQRIHVKRAPQEEPVVEVDSAMEIDEPGVLEDTPHFAPPAPEPPRTIPRAGIPRPFADRQNETNSTEVRSLRDFRGRFGPRV